MVSPGVEAVSLPVSVSLAVSGPLPPVSISPSVSDPPLVDVSSPVSKAGPLAESSSVSVSSPMAVSGGGASSASLALVSAPVEWAVSESGLGLVGPVSSGCGSVPASVSASGVDVSSTPNTAASCLSVTFVQPITQRAISNDRTIEPPSGRIPRSERFMG